MHHAAYVACATYVKGSPRTTTNNNSNNKIIMPGLDQLVSSLFMLDQQLCGLKMAALQQAASHSAWDAGSRCSSGKPQLGWVVATGFRREGTAASCGPATFLPVSRLQKHQRPLCWRTPVLLRSRPAAAMPKKLTPAMTAITCGADHSDLNLPLMQAACGDDTPCMSSPPLLPQRAQALQKPDFRQPDFQPLIQMSFAAHWKSGLHVTTRSEARCPGSARHARAEAPTDPAVSKLPSTDLTTENSVRNRTEEQLFYETPRDLAGFTGSCECSTLEQHS
ncbi:unnamed protein product [Polarella glacialis]|nr:unnamed protein product [Polarella glacialis]